MKYTFLPSDHTMLMTDTGAVRVRNITYIDLSKIEDEVITVYIDGREKPDLVSGFNALMFVYQVVPTWLEGKTFVKWKRNSWIVHNLVGHPLMQLLAFFRLYKWAMKVHDATVPQPIGYK